jgi:hypothetical protein
MTDSVVESLILDLLEWVSNGNKSYDEVVDAWRTSCPRLQVWEEVNDRSLISTDMLNGRCVVKVTASGIALLERSGHLRCSSE